MEQFMSTGRFPADEQDQTTASAVSTDKDDARARDGFIETEVRQAHWWEFSQIFVTLAAFALVANILAKLWNLLLYGDMAGKA